MKTDRLALCVIVVLAVPIPIPGLEGGETGSAAGGRHSRLLFWTDSAGRERPVTTAEEWALRRESILRGMEDAMGPLPGRTSLPPLDVREVARSEEKASTRLEISFVVERSERLPAYLFVPKGWGPRERLPAMIALHPTHPMGKGVVAGLSDRPNRSYAVELAERGYVVIAPDYPSFGDYAYDFEDDDYASGTMKGIFNHMRCVDLLVQRPDVDPERIGAIGHSLGGHNAMFLGAFDERIRVVVSSCGWTPFHDYYEGNIAGWTSPRYMPRLRDVYGLDPDRVPFDFYEVAGALAPRAFFSSSPIEDDNFAVEGVRKAIAEARKVYRLLGAEARLEARYPECGHDFPPQVREASYAFIDAALRPREPAPSGPFTLYVGTYTRGSSEGIYRLSMDPRTGSLTRRGVTSGVENPSFLAVHPSKRYLYAVNEIGTFQGERTGTVSAFAIDPASGDLTLLNRRPSGGAAPCHLTVDRTGRSLLVANYSGGSVAALRVREDGSLGEMTARVVHEGSGPDASRQKGPHAHSVDLDSTNRYVLAADLGIDRVQVYRLDPELGTLTADHSTRPLVLDPGSGPRHLALHPDGRHAYVINELASTVTAFRIDLDGGTHVKLETVSTLPESFKGKSTTAEIRISRDGRFLYGSNRGHDSIVVLAVSEDGESLRRVEHEPTGGKTPRSFEIDPSGRFLLAANQDSDSIVVLRIDPDTGALEPTGVRVEVPTPVCVTFLPR